MCCVLVFFFKQKTAYEMRISDWSSDVCSSDLRPGLGIGDWGLGRAGRGGRGIAGAGLRGGRIAALLLLSRIPALLLRIPNPQSRLPALLQQQHVQSAVELGTGRDIGAQERAAVVRARRGQRRATARGTGVCEEEGRVEE